MLQRAAVQETDPHATTATAAIDLTSGAPGTALGVATAATATAATATATTAATTATAAPAAVTADASTATVSVASTVPIATTATTSPGDVWIMGAGAIGCYLGGCLAAAGVQVHFIGRPRTLAALRQAGLTITDRDGAHRKIEATLLSLHTEPPAHGTPPTLVLLAVKSGATAEAAARLAAVLPPGTPVLSMQNGVSNAAIAAAVAPQLRVLAGMVPYNVAELAPGAWHRGTDGRLAAQDDPALRAWLPVFEGAGVPLDLHADLRAVQWGKLLINLNNPVNALSGLPLRMQLLDRGYRRCFAALIDEGLAALAAAGIAPAQLTAVPPQRLPMLLRLPDWLFRIVAARMLRIDEKARSSMADDVALGRRTEVDALCGEVVRLAQAHGGSAPRNATMVTLLDADWPKPPQRLSSQMLCGHLRL